ncbi:MAG: dTMP kinase [Dehalococcoidia bacterium]|nr:dTMP kinase [Dehalococcoidia bacterium]
MFITFEGIDGSGKSTLIEMLAAEMKKQKLKFKKLREPGDTPLGESLRTLLASHKSITPVAELALFVAARAQLVQDVIKPSLDKGEHIICDRYTDSTSAYQGYGRGLDKALIRHMNNAATQGIVPDLTCLLDLPVGQAAKRRSANLDRMEREANAFHERVRKGYIALAKAEPKRWLILDSRKKPEENLEVLLKRLKLF